MFLSEKRREKPIKTQEDIKEAERVKEDKEEEEKKVQIKSKATEEGEEEDVWEKMEKTTDVSLHIVIVSMRLTIC